MRSLYRFGMLERFLLVLWILLSSVLLITTAAATIENPDQGLVDIVHWWGYLVLLVTFTLAAMPAVRYLYRDHVADRLPWRGSSKSGGD